MSAASNHLLRTLAVLWARLGRFRIYFVAAIAILFALAALGLWHLLAPRKQIGPSSTPPATAAVARVSPGVGPSSATPTASPKAPIAAQLPRDIAIIEVTEAEERGPRGETYIVAKIGMASQTTTEKDKVEIHVAFFDLTPDNQMRPTDAQVTYQWITPVRDWTDPTPKYLAATYLNHRPRRHARERLRYGGFVVRVFSGGKLQDERSQPETLLSQLRTNATHQTPTPPIVPPASTPSPAVASAKADTPSPPTDGFAAAKPSPQPTSDVRPPTSDSTLPYGKPIPGKPGFVQSPYDPKFTIDVRGFPPGTLVNDPNTNKPFRIP